MRPLEQADADDRIARPRENGRSVLEELPLEDDDAQQPSSVPDEDELLAAATRAWKAAYEIREMHPGTYATATRHLVHAVIARAAPDMLGDDEFEERVELRALEIPVETEQASAQIATYVTSRLQQMIPAMLDKHHDDTRLWREGVSLERSMVARDDRDNDEENPAADEDAEAILRDEIASPEFRVPLEDRDAVERLLLELLPRDRDILRLYYGFEHGGAEYTYEQIGEMYGIGVSAVGSRINNALERLAKIIEVQGLLD